MELRELDIAEHFRTRRLWETVFPEDTRDFLDYYYFFKARQNRIFVMEEQEEIRAMLQLNPYLLQSGSRQFTGHYIVGVATEEKYRRQGAMQRLLIGAMREMYRQKELFTFLMPAAESIYSPYDFRFIYDQWQEELSVPCPDARTEAADTFSDTGSVLSDAGSIFSDADAVLSDAGEMAEFFQGHFAEHFQVYAIHDAAYYRMMLFEQQSERGGIRLLRRNSRLAGMFFYSREESLEIREPLYLKEAEAAFYASVARLCREGQTRVKIFAAESGKGEKRPTIMARLLHPELLFPAMQVLPGKTIDCSFAVTDPLLIQNNRIWRLTGGLDGGTEVSVRETEDSQGLLTIGALTSLLFGYKSIEEIAREEGVIMGEELKEGLSALRPLSPVFLNELV